MLVQTQDAEDAFQATFLILSRKCKTLLDHGSVAGWLYQTAVRNCLQIRRRKSRTKETEMVIDPIRFDEPWEEISKAQEKDLVFQEINRLPRRYRDAIVLCHLNGHTRAEAAELLNSTEASVKAALVRGRNMLRRRLIRSGIFTSAILVTLRAATANAQDHVTEPLVEAAIELAQGITPNATLGTSSQFVQTLANQGIMSLNTTIIFKSLSAAAAILLAIAIPVVVYAQHAKVDVQAITMIDSASTQKSEPSETQPQFQLASIDGEDHAAKLSAKNEPGETTVATQNAKVKLQEPNPPVDRPAKPRAKVKKKSRVIDEGQFNIQNSKEYWNLMLQSYTLRTEALKRVANKKEATQEERLTAQADIYEFKAKAIAAKLNIARIELEKTNRLKRPKSATALAAARPPIQTQPKAKTPDRSEAIKARISEFRVKLAEGTRRLGPGHATIVNLKDMIAVLEDELEKLNSPEIPPASTDPVKPGEVLTIESDADESIDRRVTVLSDHKISLPLVGIIDVRGLTTQMISERLDKAYSEFLKDPSIFVGRESVTTPLQK